MDNYDIVAENLDKRVKKLSSERRNVRRFFVFDTQRGKQINLLKEVIASGIKVDCEKNGIWNVTISD